MSSKIKVLQVIPRLGYGGAETGCFDLAHYLCENNCSSFIVTSGGELIKYINRKKVKLIKLPVHSKNPLLILFKFFALVFIILFLNIFPNAKKKLFIIKSGDHSLSKKNYLNKICNELDTMIKNII